MPRVTLHEPAPERACALAITGLSRPLGAARARPPPAPISSRGAAGAQGHTYALQTCFLGKQAFFCPCLWALVDRLLGWGRRVGGSWFWGPCHPSAPGAFCPRPPRCSPPPLQPPALVSALSFLSPLWMFYLLITHRTSPLSILCKGFFPCCLQAKLVGRMNFSFVVPLFCSCRQESGTHVPLSVTRDMTHLDLQVLFCHVP